MRQTDELRPLSFETGVQLHAGGSCLVKLGRTHVLCAASLEEKVPAWMKGKGSGWLTAEYGMLPAATHTRSDREAARGKQQGRTVEIQRLIGRSLRQAVDLGLLGERTLAVDCDVLNADGGTRCAAITGAWVAVALALKAQGLSAALVRQVAAVSAGLVDADVAGGLGPATTWGSKGEHRERSEQAVPPFMTGEGRRGMLLDLEYEEDHLAAVDCNLVAARPSSGGALELVELQGTGEGRSFTRAEALGLMDLGLAGCATLMEVQRKAMV